jgi:hypothetical protein
MPKWEAIICKIKFNKMKKMQSLNSELFQTLESYEMIKINGGGPTKAVDPNSMTGNGPGTTGSKWDGADPYNDSAL